jgi:undecaprenyl phosphate N,N'-diacetylbacillosamine 1-phosphate transferase
LYRRFLKRVFDLALALIALPFWLIIVIVIGPIIYFEDKGPIFYNALRLGKDSKIFKMYKFRSMKVNAVDLRNEDGSTFNSEDDSRLTKIGKFIRKTSIDETPQLLNIFKGDMSIIGPRPDLPEHISYYEGDEKRKLDVLPGITGYNQAYYRNSAEWKDRLKNDVYYVDHLSLWLDIKVFFKTIESIIFKKGIYVSSDSKKVEGENINV